MGFGEIVGISYLNIYSNNVKVTLHFVKRVSAKECLFWGIILVFEGLGGILRSDRLVRIGMFFLFTKDGQT